MSTEFEIRNLLPRFCRLTFNRNLLTQICAVTAVFIGTFAVTLSATAGTIDDVRSRDKLICGASEGLPGFSEKDGSGNWRGFDVDFCKAVADALLGDTAKVEYVPLSATVRFDALTDRLHKLNLCIRKTAARLV
jgi:ABC-type amino acid transport substrate-binding protein